MDNDVNLMMIVGVWLLHAGDRLRDAVPSASRTSCCATTASATSWCATRAARTGSTTPASTSTATSSARSWCARRARASARRCRSASASWRASRSIRERPLWQFHLIDGYEGGSALIARVHHCIGDGIALISVMMAITDGGSEPPRARAPRAADADDGGDWLADAVLKPLGGLSAKAAGARRSVDRARARGARRSAAGTRRDRSPTPASAPR